MNEPDSVFMNCGHGGIFLFLHTNFEKKEKKNLKEFVNNVRWILLFKQEFAFYVGKVFKKSSE